MTTTSQIFRESLRRPGISKKGLTFMRLLLLSAIFVMATPVALAAQDTASSPIEKPAKPAKPKKICRTTPGGEPTGSHMSPPRECHTAQEWLALEGTTGNPALSSSRSGRSTPTDSD